MKAAQRIAVILVLTLLTQVGGLIYLLSIPAYRYLSDRVKSKVAKVGVKIGTFLFMYVGLSFTVVPLLAGVFGRVPLPILRSAEGIHPNNIMTCLMNRHYVRKELLEVLGRAAAQSGQPIYYMDGNFPFINGFPLLPHWSHNDGKKIDVTYYYEDKTNAGVLRSSPSWIGYGFCEEPTTGEVDMPCECAKKGYHQYSMLRPLVHQSLHDNYKVYTIETAKLIRILAADPSISMIFIEPHLKHRWRLDDVGKIRFHGCHAVRHDDHIHVQIR